MSELGGKVVPVTIEDEMKKSYIDYAMSVIVGRALPDVRDGLKPIHRRILYAMSELNLTPDRPHRKSATIVGDVMGKYHPHGDAAIYDAMVRLAQDFSIRYPLIDGHGNFGSIDGDPPAAMRYTEARLSRIALEMLSDIDKDTVDFIPNFDDTLKEPAVLPSRFPNLLVNGSSGIAVGMATNIPPHNLSEVIDGVVMMIENPDVTSQELMAAIKGPDFPTGGIILGREGIREMYTTGRGSIIVRAKATIEPMEGGKQRIVVTEIPYMVNKARLIEKIAELVRDKHLDGISDLRDESDRNGLRIVIELKRDANAHVILNQLYKHTQMQVTFGAIMLALVENKPQVLTLREMIYHYLRHQQEVVVRRTKYELARAEERVHILEGLRIALNHLDEVIALIRKSKDVPTAREGLMKNFGLTEKQAQVILDMRLQRLTALERQKIEDEYRELLEKIDYYKRVLGDEKLVFAIIKEELLKIKERFGDERRTRIVAEVKDFDEQDLIPEEDVVITMTYMGYVKRMPLSSYRSQKRGGKGVTGITTREEDFVERILVATTHHVVLFFTNQGNVYRLKAHEIPEAGRTAKGTAIVNLLPLKPQEKVNAVIPIKDFGEASYLVMVTKRGLVKKTLLSEYESSRKTGIIAITLTSGDELIGVKLVGKKDELILGTSHGMSIRFSVEDVTPTGRTARGVKAITLGEGDEVASMDVTSVGSDVLVITEKGFGKRTPLDEYRIQTRGGRGIITQRVTDTTGRLVGLRVVAEGDDIILCTASGMMIRLEVSGISSMSRNTRGVTLMKLEEGDQVSAVAVIRESED
ncbi:DNA gyrase subunit A [Thermosediminibacter oceani]|uniref:DNA gyrase subunit A n=1 Tax=Thermosediminibacter oceani (strain ATCC BAA-1034 / DSM 16646 / JW/IW-1228P) TaxID=555079 RepID=D9RYX7_THEOJ|nr:DNA gyrase subunit A [Thermosediminibacter oceani]ADL06805.1 DNA gyrase subunit A [Thermosediminibacter oceani DSM 16646]